MFNNRWLSWAIVVLALVGLFDATYLTAEHFLGATPACFVTTGCDTVLTSRYATLGPIPLSLVGLAYYVVMLVTGIRLSLQPKRSLVNGMAVITSLGFITSVGLVYLQLGVIHAICAYCMISASTSTLLWVVSLLLWRAQKTPKA